MKRLLAVFLCISVLFGCIAVHCSAADTDAEKHGESFGEAGEDGTLTSRLFEFVSRYKSEVLTVIGDVALIAFAVYAKLKRGKGDKEINAALDRIKQETGLSLTNQGSVVDVINDLIDSYNSQTAEYTKLRETYERYGETELDRNKVIGALAAEISTVLDILSAVYVNNRNLPQGIKDLINMKYARCMKMLESDGELASVVAAVRHAVGGNEESGISDGAEAET